MLSVLDKEYSVTRKDLISLLVHQDVKVHYQGIFNPNTNELLGLEALSRLHKNNEIHLPGTFIGKFITNGIDTHLDMHVIKMVAKNISSWGVYSPKVNINFSINQFEDARISERLTQLLAVNDISPSMVKIELTEGQRIYDFKNISKKLSGLKDEGFSIALDDFGSGYSTLVMLKELPFVDDVKLDRMFIEDMNKDSSKRLIEEFGGFIQKLGHRFIVEGVETQEQLEFLKETGVVNGVQGFHLHMPELIKSTQQLSSLSTHPIKLA